MHSILIKRRKCANISQRRQQVYISPLSTANAYHCFFVHGHIELDSIGRKNAQKGQRRSFFHSQSFVNANTQNILQICLVYRNTAQVRLTKLMAKTNLYAYNFSFTQQRHYAHTGLSFQNKTKSERDLVCLTSYGDWWELAFLQSITTDRSGFQMLISRLALPYWKIALTAFFTHNSRYST